MDDRQWRQLQGVLGHPQWCLAPDLRTATGRVAARARLDEGLSRWCGTRTADDVVEALWPAGVPAARLVAPHEVVSLPQTASRGFFETVHHPVVGSLRLPVFPARFESRSRPYHAVHAPLLGQDNRAILGGWLGLDDTELDTLEHDGIIGTRPA
jgi:crotonobetainyl-CoA:carnitine CoA-transferase CaiB-like acyl-CoA transferase